MFGLFYCLNFLITHTKPIESSKSDVIIFFNFDSMFNSKQIHVHTILTHQFVKQTIVLIAMVCFLLQNVQAQIGIGTQLPDSSARLELKHSAKGILSPRMSKLQRLAIVQPAKGLMVYQTDDAVGYYYNEGAPASPSWKLLQTVWVKEAAGVSFSNAKVGIGKSNPAHPLDMNGKIAVNANPTINWIDFTDPLIHEFSFSSFNNFAVTPSGIPSGARYILADVFLTYPSSDAFNMLLGRNLGTNPVTWVNSRGAQPSAAFTTASLGHCIKLSYQGETDGYTPYYGQWSSSQIIPLKTGGGFDALASGMYSVGKGWVYMVIRAYSY